MNKYILVRNKLLSIMVYKQFIGVLACLLLLTVCLFIVSLGFGSVAIHPVDVVKTLMGQGSETHDVIVRSLRLPRVIVSVLAGAALAVSGAILQGVTRNPLSSPDSIGITSGATLGAVIFFYYWADQASFQWIPFVAMIGAFAAIFLIYLMAWKSGVSPLRVILIGTSMATLLNAFTYMLLISAPFILANKSLTFMTGSVYGVSWKQDVSILLPWVAILLPIAFLLSRNLNVQELGEEVATSVGSSVQKQRVVLLIVSVALAGVAVAIAGAISFIGLMAPHLARKLVGPSYGGVLPISACLGACILLAADLTARTAFAPLDIPAGVFTAAIGAPYFIFMLYRNRNR